MSSSISYELFKTKKLQNSEFIVNAATIANGTAISYSTVFINGADITKPTASTIELTVGHVYLVSYIFRGTVVVATNFTVTPRFNSVTQGQFSTTSDVTLAANTSVSGTFLADASLVAITLDFLYNSSSSSTSSQGSVSIVQVI